MKCGKRLSVVQRQEIGLSVHKRPCKASLARRYKCTRSAVDRWLEEGLKEDPDYREREKNKVFLRASKLHKEVGKEWLIQEIFCVQDSTHTPCPCFEIHCPSHTHRQKISTRILRRAQVGDPPGKKQTCPRSVLPGQATTTCVHLGIY
jgi:hypothetical protein